VVKCPFCGFANEEGALFCEQCKSDVSNVAPPAAAAPAPPAAAVFDDAPILATLAEEAPPPAAAIVDEAVIAAAVVEEPVVITAEVPPPVTPPGAMMAAGESVPPEIVEVPAVAVEAAAVVATAEPAPAAEAPPAKPAATGTPIPAGAAVKLVVQRGLKIGEEFPLYPGENFVGRADEKPVDVDLTFQEPEDRVWCSRQHALLQYDDATGNLTVEDLNSSNGTFVNRERVYPGQPKTLYVGSTIQIGTVHMKVKV
jgi:hypothetical protein